MNSYHTRCKNCDKWIYGYHYKYIDKWSWFHNTGPKACVKGFFRTILNGFTEAQPRTGWYEDHNSDLRMRRTAYE